MVGLPQRGTRHRMAGTQVSRWPSLDTALRTSVPPPRRPDPACSIPTVQLAQMQHSCAKSPLLQRVTFPAVPSLS